jgi:hypothetical protein
MLDLTQWSLYFLILEVVVFFRVGRRWHSSALSQVFSRGESDPSDDTKKDQQSIENQKENLVRVDVSGMNSEYNIEFS